MERSSEGLKEPSKTHEQSWYESMETRNEGPGSSGQRFLHDPSNSININARLPEFNLPSGVKPVLNYSFQTGEEFALEFMRERANPRKLFVPKAPSDWSGKPVYTDLRMLGINPMGSESGSEVSMPAMGEKELVKEFDKKDSFETDNRSYYESARSQPRTSTGDGSSRGVAHGYISSGASDNSSTKMKFLCSFGGKILPRPSDAKLRYVGGDTRIIRIIKDISFQELMQKASTIYNQAHTIKYQLPGEDLDALVSVSCDEDLQNMIEECSVLEGGEGSQKLRMFLFSASEMEDTHFGLGSMEGDSEIQYVVAVNGVDLGPAKNSSGHGFASTSANDLDQLFSLNVGGGSVGVETGSVGTIAAPSTSILAPPSTTLSSMPMQASYSNDYEPHVPIPSHYVYNSHYAPDGQDPVPMSFNTIPSLPQGGSHGVDGSIQKNNEVEQSRYFENEFISSMQQSDGSVSNYFPSEVSFSTQDRGTSLFSSQHNEKHQELVQGSTPQDAENASQPQVPNDDDHYYASGPAYANSESDQTEFSHYEPPLLPQRVFHSERIPREQMELMNRLSKSDDSMGSQYLIPHPSLVPQEPITESVDPSHEGNLGSEQTNVSAKPALMNPLTVEDDLLQFENYKGLADAITHMKQHEPMFSKEGLISGNIAQHNLHGLEEDSNSGEMSWVKGNLKELSVGKEELVAKESPSAGSDIDVKQQEDPTSGLPEPHWGEMGTKATNDNIAMGQAPHFGAPPEQGDILIDINDRFPPNLLSDIFSKARIPQDAPGISLLRQDDTGLSLNMQNHEPKRWSFFRNLAQDVRKDVSLMDQDHIVFPSPLTNVEAGGPRAYGFSPLEGERVAVGHVDQQIEFDEGIQQELSGIAGADTSGVRTGYIPSQVIHPNLMESSSEGVQVEEISFSKQAGELRTLDSEFEEGKLEVGNTGGPMVDYSAGNFDIDIIDLQIIKNEDLEELKELGSGTFGTVYHGKWRGSDVAIKRIKKSCFTGRSSEQERLTVEFWREAEILSRLHHPNVVAFYGVVQDGPGATLATVTEYMVNGSLRHVLLRKDRYLDRRKRLIIAMDAAFGMEYLHSKNIVHFDLKCDNLLVNLKDPLRPICKVGDFGLSKIKRNTLVSGGVRGTLPWMAPELLNGSSSKVSEKVDVFSFGIVMWEILTGEEPYANMHYGAIIGGIVNNTLRPPVPSFCDPEWRRLMEQCWAPDPGARPSFTEIARRLRNMSVAVQAKTPGHQAQNQAIK
ncbi:kinase superfamily with octicosapeptide/Phox/Bem1p domain-containing protein [Tasmannia lanceolata]|uniref:kinase superfamily with octicosapeptide/Phox/Bem1p domain-containing protein n=1 Tax=Tasmannia lanceolata TaxID=3420 RepID=UPI004064812B